MTGQRNPPLPEGELKENPVKAQIKLLQDHYNVTARQPATVRCSIDLAPPQACITCPQTRYGVAEGHAPGMLLQNMAYGPDVPDEVIAKSRVCMCVHDMLSSFLGIRTAQFVVNL